MAIADLYLAGEDGGAYDISDPAHVWQDTARTVPIAAGQPVAAIDDLSGNGRHIIIPVAAQRPVWQQDGSGIGHILFDGVDDTLPLGVSQFNIGPPGIDLFYAYDTLGATAGMFLAGNGAVPWAAAWETGSGSFQMTDLDNSTDSGNFLNSVIRDGVTESILTRGAFATLISAAGPQRLIFPLAIQSNTFVSPFQVGFYPGASVFNLRGRLYGFGWRDRSGSTAERAEIDTWLAGLLVAGGGAGASGAVSAAAALVAGSASRAAAGAGASTPPVAIVSGSAGRVAVAAGAGSPASAAASGGASRTARASGAAAPAVAAASGVGTRIATASGAAAPAPALASGAGTRIATASGAAEAPAAVGAGGTVALNGGTALAPAATASGAAARGAAALGATRAPTILASGAASRVASGSGAVIIPFPVPHGAGRRSAFAAGGTLAPAAMAVGGEPAEIVPDAVFTVTRRHIEAFSVRRSQA